MKDNQKRIITTQKIDDYCLWLDRCERSRETIQKYEYYLTRFKEFMDCRPVDKEMVILWKSVLRENLAPVTVNGALAALNGCQAHCSVILSPPDESTYKKLGLQLTCEPQYQTNNLYHR